MKRAGRLREEKECRPEAWRHEGLEELEERKRQAATS
jgi:hypothetical protein